MRSFRGFVVLYGIVIMLSLLMNGHFCCNKCTDTISQYEKRMKYYYDRMGFVIDHYLQELRLEYEEALRLMLGEML